MLAILRALPIWGHILTWGTTAAVVIATTGIGYGLWHHKVFTEGYQAAIHEIVAENERAIDVARKARARWRNCVAADGMHWDQSTGQCERGEL